MPKVLITTVPFADKSRLPLELLENAGIDYLINPLNKKLNENELAELITDFDAIIAGTEKISKKVMEQATNLKIISRVGIGLDSVDLLEAKKRNIIVSYTPDAPAPAVAELTIGMMLTMIRSIHVSNSQMHKGQWYRYFGRRLSEVTVGIIGVGRIGKLVLNHLKGLGAHKVLLNDTNSNQKLENEIDIEWVDKEQIYKDADIISIHTPLTSQTKNMICKEELLSMKKDAIVINTARGGIINEDDLYDVLYDNHLSGAAIDVFEEEPYGGRLREIESCLLTAHMGSMSIDCRTLMELEATEEVIRFLTNLPLEGVVPEEEYEVQKQGL